MNRRRRERRGRRGRGTVSELRVLGCAVLLAGGVAAAVSAGLARHAAHDAPGVAGVHLARLVAQQTARAARNGVSEARTAPGRTVVETRAWALALEAALARVAHRHGVVLLPARAIAAGAPDLTGEVEAAVAEILAQGPSGRTATPREDGP